MLTAAVVAASILCLGAVPASAATHYVRVTPDNFKSIFSRGDSRPVSSYTFVIGPAKPPLGIGSLQLTTADTNGKQQHLEVQQQGTPISQIDKMGYGTYQHAGSTPQIVVSINMEIFTNPGQPNCTNAPVPGETCNRYTTLAFEPYQNGVVTPGQWQIWDAYRGGNALWHPSYTRPIPGSGPAGGPPVPWSTIVAANPHAVVISYGVNQGTFNPNVTSNADALYIGTPANRWVYDFEPSRSQCKSGGYAQFTNPTFKNQGQCERYFDAHSPGGTEGGGGDTGGDDGGDRSGDGHNHGGDGHNHGGDGGNHGGGGGGNE